MKKILIIAAFIGLGITAHAQNANPAKGKETPTVATPSNTTKEANIASSNTVTKDADKKECATDKKSCGDMKKAHSCCSGKAKSEK